MSGIQEFLIAIGLGILLGFSLLSFIQVGQTKKRLLSKKWIYTVELYSNGKTLNWQQGLLTITDAPELTFDELKTYILKAAHERGRTADDIKILMFTRLV